MIVRYERHYDNGIDGAQCPKCLTSMLQDFDLSEDLQVPGVREKHINRLAIPLC